MQKCGEIMRRYHPDATIFFNSGGANQYKSDYHELQTHFEMEDLPTAWGGYNKLPLRAKFFEGYGKPTLAMTGKFHLDWGEFGGFKPKEALKYEVAMMALYGVGASVGDHMHPDGKAEMQTYENIGYAYDYLSRIAPYCYGGKGVADLGLYPSDNKGANEGISNILCECQTDYEIVRDGNFKEFRTVILSEGARLSEWELDKLGEYIRDGGRILWMADTLKDEEELLSELGIKYQREAEYDCDYLIPAKRDEDLPFAPMLCNIPSHRVEALKGEIVAEAIDPYFSRTMGHFCGHKNTPHDKNSERRAAIIKGERSVYLAHPLARQYYEFGSVYHKRYFIPKRINQL